MSLTQRTTWRNVPSALLGRQSTTLTREPAKTFGNWPGFVSVDLSFYFLLGPVDPSAYDKICI